MKYLIEYVNGTTFTWQPNIKDADQLNAVKNIILSNSDVKKIIEL